MAALALALASYQVTLIVLPLLLWIAVLFFRSGQSRVMQFVLLLIGLALGLTLGVEYVVLDGDIGRQNTVFKFYLAGVADVQCGRRGGLRLADQRRLALEAVAAQRMDVRAGAAGRCGRAVPDYGDARQSGFPLRFGELRAAHARWHGLHEVRQTERGKRRG